MLRWAVTFLVVAIIAAIMGFGNIAGAATGIAMMLFWLFLAITVIFFVIGLASGGRRPTI